jgi:hypothetical protein
LNSGASGEDALTKEAAERLVLDITQELQSRYVDFQDNLAAHDGSTRDVYRIQPSQGGRAVTSNSRKYREV